MLWGGRPSSRAIEALPLCHAERRVAVDRDQTEPLVPTARSDHASALTAAEGVDEAGCEVAGNLMQVRRE